MNNKFLGVGKSIIEIEKELLSDEDLKNRAGDVELFYESHFKKVLALWEYEWLKSLGTKDWTKDSTEHAIWHQGAIHCLREMREWFESQVRLSRSRFDEEKKQKEGESIPSI